ncbi:MAG TPA: threonine--tRNA ligase [Candidatus Saccharibacteria bacterium]|nr:threonine--tRNA ligase [Candidatus Saccharibacteria bacterium]
MKSSDRIQTMRHSLAHIMAAAVHKLWPQAKFGVGPVIDNGFYYDIEIEKTTLSEEDFSKIEKTMKSIIASALPFEKTEMGVDAAIDWAKDSHQPYKKELLEDLKNRGTTGLKEIDYQSVSQGVKKVTLYKTGDFVDLCRGPHVTSTKDVGVFKIVSVAGAYWRGKETNPQMQRLYAVAFETQSELDEYLEKVEEAKRRDHRKLGRQLDLYHIDNQVGNGLILWHPKGALIWRKIEDYWYKEHLRNGYDLVRSPHIGSRLLWEKSGHWGFYSGSMYPPLEAGQSLEDVKNSKSVAKSEQYLLKPMNCPFHIQIYKNKLYSYKELPLRWAEMGTVYRFEKTGELSGLTRVRGFTQDDAHIICREDQVEHELKQVIDFILDIYKAFGFDKQAVQVYLSLRDPNDKAKYAGDDKGWEFTEKVLRQVSEEKELDYITEVGEAAFYGPKLDFKLKDVIGREWQCSTLQFDFNLPNRFDMTYVNASSQEKRPYVLHRALFGSMERFIGLLIEHYNGAFPLWLSPEQLRVITVNQTEKIVNYAKEVVKNAVDLDIRAVLDDSNESVGKKVRMSESQKIPYTIVIGDKEVETGKTTPRIRTDLLVQPAKSIRLDNFIRTLSNESKARVSRTTI